MIDFLLLLPKDSLRIKVEDADDIFTEEDETVYRQAVRELEAGEAISLDKAKKELLGTNVGQPPFLTGERWMAD